MRASEHIESDNTFLGLFAPGALDVLPADEIWSRPHRLLSAPGGGKTTLLRLFAPDSLWTLHEFQARKELEDLHARVTALGALGDSGPTTLGAITSLAKSYSTIDDLFTDTIRQSRVFAALLNARVTLSILRAAIALRRLDFPRDLSHLAFGLPPGNEIPPGFPLPCNGQVLFEWAKSLETRVCDAMDSFVPKADQLAGSDDLHALTAFSPESILVDGQPLASRILLMFDDAHKLTPRQHYQLLEALDRLRPRNAVWIAERLEALTPEQALDHTATPGRDYGRPIRLEEFWRQASNSKRFEKIVVNIADRRASLTRDIDVSNFASCLIDSIDTADWRDKFELAARETRERIARKVKTNTIFQAWFDARDAELGTARQRAESWRALEILIDRETSARQQKLETGLAFPVDELHQRESSAVRNAAEFIIAQDYGIPYYFSLGRLSDLSSSNIEQFLAFGGDLFEEIVAASILRPRSSLTPARQEQILRESARQRWDEIATTIPNGREVQNLLEGIRQVCRGEFEKGTASYGAAGAPTGIGMSMEDRGMLIKFAQEGRSPDFQRLVDALHSAIINNLLEVNLNVPQGGPGQQWMVLYLNRWLCLHFNLPLQYGGWRKRKPDELIRWMNRGMRTLPKEVLRS